MTYRTQAPSAMGNILPEQGAKEFFILHWSGQAMCSKAACLPLTHHIM